MKYEDIREGLYITLLHEGETLDGVPQRKYEDLTMVYRYRENPYDDVTQCKFVTNQMIEEAAISMDQLHTDATHVSNRNHLAFFKGMRELLGLPGRNDEDEVPMYVLSTVDAKLGASAIFYEGMMELIAEKLGGDYYVLPSSIHELIIIPASKISAGDQEGIRGIIGGVNDSEVASCDKLSDNLYYYNTKTRKMTVV